MSPTKRNAPKVYLVVPVFNRVEKTMEFLASVKKLSYDKIITIIVDDGSTDGTERKIKDRYPEVIILKGTGSLWWAGSTNLGVKYALDHGRDGDYVYTINNDTVLSAETLDCLVDSAQKNPHWNRCL